MAIRAASTFRRRYFEKLERRTFCGCELCRLRFGRMLYNRFRSGEPLRSYRRYQISGRRSQAAGPGPAYIPGLTKGAPMIWIDKVAVAWALTLWVILSQLARSDM